MTGIKPGAFSVSLNERSLGGSIVANVLEDVLFGTTTVAHLVRQVSSAHLIQLPSVQSLKLSVCKNMIL